MKTVAIDGPSGAGKSTIAKAVAARLGFVYVDTGAIYRTIAYDMLRNGIDVKDEAAVSRRLPALKLELQYTDGEQVVLVNGEDVSDKIRTPEVSMATSAVSALAPVREYILEMQRSVARQQNVIMDGRDIATVVLPDADVKIYLTASSRSRAQRRWKELLEKGMDVTLEQVQADVEERDYNDSHRDVAPLVQAEDAILVDTSGFSLEQSTETILHIVKERL